METMFQYIDETAEQCLNNIHNSRELTAVITDSFLRKEYKRIVAVASGSSYHAVLTGKYYMEKMLKIPVNVVTSYTFNNYENIIEEDTFYIGVGQSGRSNNTNGAMRKIMGHGFPVIGVTGNTESVMKNNCTVICNWGVGIEKIGFVTKGFSTAALFFMLFALESSLALGYITENEYQKEKEEFVQIYQRFPEFINKAKNWYNENEKELTQMYRVQVVGAGPFYAIAREGSLKMEETMGKASSAFELEEFLHGPCYEINDDSTVIIVGGFSQRATDVYRNIQLMTEHAFLITNLKIDNDKHVFSIPEETDELKICLLDVIVFQIVSASVNIKWTNPNLEKRLAVTTALDTKTRKTGKEVGL